VPADLLAIQINVCQIIGAAEVNKRARVWFARVIERLLVPDRALIEEQLVRLRVPIARHVQRSGAIKVILDELALRLWLGVLEITIVAWLITVVVVTRLVRIDDDLPLTVEIDRLASVCIRDQICLLGVDGRRQSEQK